MTISTTTLYKCDICGKVSEWIKGQWIAHVFLIKDDEYEFHLCSEDCDLKLLDTPKSDKISLYKSVRGRVKPVCK